MIEVPHNKGHIKVHIKYRSGTDEGVLTLPQGEVCRGFLQQMTLKQGLKEEVGLSGLQMEGRSDDNDDHYLLSVRHYSHGLRSKLILPP